MAGEGAGETLPPGDRASVWETKTFCRRIVGMVAQRCDCPQCCCRVQRPILCHVDVTRIKTNNIYLKNCFSSWTMGGVQREKVMKVTKMAKVPRILIRDGIFNKLVSSSLLRNLLGGLVSFNTNPSLLGEGRA